MSTTSLKLPDEPKQRVVAAAEMKGISPHVFMVHAIEQAATAAETVGLIEEAVELLVRHPLTGRPLEYELRELVISRGHTGYVALYGFEEARGAVLILAIRHQREAGYWGQDDD